MDRRFKRVVVVGSIGFDQIMELPGTFSEWILPDQLDSLNVSFTVSSLRREYGGTGGNCAYTLGLLGKRPILVSILGRDGEEYRKHLEAAGVDVSAVVMEEDNLSALGTVMTDKQQNQIWNYYPGPLVQLADYSLQSTVKPNDLVVLMPSEPRAYKKHLREVVSKNTRYMFDPAFFIPNLTAEELTLGIEKAQIVIGNEYEIEMMARKTQTTVRQWFDDGSTVVIKTLGERGVEMWQGRDHWQIPAVSVKKAVDPTGAGDAFRAGFLAGYIDGLPLEDCARMGAVAGAYCVENQGTQNFTFTPAAFSRRLKNYTLERFIIK